MTLNRKSVRFLMLYWTAISTSTTFKSPLIMRASWGTGGIGYSLGGGGAVSQGHPPDLSHQNDVLLADGGRPPPVQPFLPDRVSLDCAEKPQGGLLTGADGVDAGSSPDHDDESDSKDDDTAQAPPPPRRPKIRPNPERAEPNI